MQILNKHRNTKFNNVLKIMYHNQVEFTPGGKANIWKPKRSYHMNEREKKNSSIDTEKHWQKPNTHSW